MKVRVQDEEVSFNLWEAMKHPKDKGVCFKMDAIDEAVLDVKNQVMKPYPLEQVLTDALSDIDSDGEQEIKECLKELDAFKEVSPLESKIEELKDEPKPVEVKLELKTLPSHLKYVFLEEGDNNPVIINNSLSTLEENILIQVLKKNKEAIGWKLSDLK
ncbi:hypothetical protein A2U01_0049878, partial [Trifolium medium]|nr:hypothetical protein [Trifolium medium]